MDHKARIMVPRFFVPQRHLRMMLLFALVPLCIFIIVLFAWRFRMFNYNNDFDSRFASGTRQQLERELLIMNLMNEMSTGHFGPVRQKENEPRTESLIWFPAQRRRASKIDNKNDAINEFIVYVLNLILFPETQVIPLTSLRMDGTGIQERPGGFAPIIVELCYDRKWKCTHAEFNPMEDGDVCFLNDRRWFPKLNLDQVKILAFLLNSFDSTRCALIPNRESEEGGAILVGYSFKWISNDDNGNDVYNNNNSDSLDGWKVEALCDLDPIAVQTIKWFKSSREDLHSLIATFMHRSTLPKSVQRVVSEHEDQVSKLARMIDARFGVLVEILDTKCHDMEALADDDDDEDDDI